MPGSRSLDHRSFLVILQRIALAVGDQRQGYARWQDQAVNAMRCQLRGDAEAVDLGQAGVGRYVEYGQLVHTIPRKWEAPPALLLTERTCLQA